MSIFDHLISTLAPHDCLGCGAEGAILCVACQNRLVRAIERCYRCHTLVAGARTCDSCLRASRLHRVWAACVYEGVAKSLVWQLKFSGVQAATRQMAGRMLAGLEPARDSLIVPVPTATGRVRQRGYDQAELLAREVARQSRQHYASCLARVGQAHQVGALREQRLQQLRASFRVTRPHWLRGQHIILVDDVITTGATLEAAANVLRAAGVRRVDAVVFAQA